MRGNILKHDTPIRLTITLTPDLYDDVVEEAIRKFGKRRGAIQFLIEEVLRSYLKKPSGMER